MSALPVPENVRAVLQRLPGWFPGAVGWSVRLANHGPRWLPVKLRCAPLWCAGVVVRLVVAAPGYGGTPPWKRSATAPALSCWHTSANPAGLALDAGHAARTPPNEPTRHERPDPASGGSAGTQDSSHLCTNERISQ
jgi:hypothetical protein